MMEVPGCGCAAKGIDMKSEHLGTVRRCSPVQLSSAADFKFEKRYGSQCVSCTKSESDVQSLSVDHEVIQVDSSDDDSLSHVEQNDYAQFQILRNGTQKSTASSTLPAAGKSTKRRTIPHGWYVRVGYTTPNDTSQGAANIGIWTKHFIPEGIVFGPFKLHKPTTQAQTDGKTRDESSETSVLSQIVAGREDLPVSSLTEDSDVAWIKYLNWTSKEVNICAVLAEDELFFETVADVQPNTELRASNMSNANCEQAPRMKANAQPDTVLRASNANSDSEQEPNMEASVQPDTELRVSSVNSDSEQNSNQASVSSEQPLELCACSDKQDGRSSQLPTGRNKIEIHCGKKCDTCGKYYSLAISNEVPQANDKNPETHKCDVCGKCFSQATHLSRHYKKQHGRNSMIEKAEKPYKCAECGECYKEASSISEHVKSLHGPGRYPHFKYYVCNICQKPYGGWGVLSKHIKLNHSDDKAHKCEFCNAAFSKACKYLKHLQSHTLEKEHKCKECGKCYLKAKDLSLHMKIHQEKPFECQVCGKRFATSMAKHMELHKAKPYECKICGKWFSEATARNKHMNNHRELKNHKCNFCDETFTTQSSKFYHMKKAHSEQPCYECDVCNKCFVLHGNLQRHMIVHTGERPFECALCGVCYKSKQALSIHKTRIHSSH